jgi:hypothetical protein
MIGGLGGRLPRRGEVAELLGRELAVHPEPEAALERPDAGDAVTLEP